MFNSLRTRLLIWQVLLLTAVLVSFGSIIYFQWRKSLVSDLDKQLLSSAAVLEGTLRGVGVPQHRSHLPPPRRPLPQDRPPPNQFPPNQRQRPGEQSPQNRRGNPPGIGDLARGARSAGPDILAGTVDANIFNLPHDLVMNPRRTQATYFVIYDINDQIIASTPNRKFRVPRSPDRQHFVDIGSDREIVLNAPGRTRILVGHDIADLNRQASVFLLRIFLIGLGILAVGCVAGYWVTGRAIAPIREVGKTVQAISGTNLERRIDTSKMDSEFIHLSALLNEMLDRLESTIEQQKLFIADASHELRTPVSVIGMHAELALATERTSEEYKKTLQTCLRASDRLKSLTEDLLTLAKSDAGHLLNDRTPVDLSQVVSESVEFLRPFAEQNNVAMSDESQSMAMVRGDKRLLRQLIDNLITNAIVHNRPGGSATITVDSDESGATLSVWNDGSGIPENELPKLFDRFFRIDSSRSRESGGSGLGLSICQSIARIHGGAISVNSTPETGTVFELFLPSNPDLVA